MPGQQYSTSSLGGYFSQPYLTDQLRHQAQPEYRFRQFVDAKEAIGRNRGDTFLFDRAGNVATQGTVLTETNTVPQTQFSVGQGTCVITEYANSIPFTGKLDALGQIQVEPATQQKLRDDMVKALESAAGAQFINTEFIAVASSTANVVITTNGTATATATADLTAYNVRAVVDFMKKKLIPKYDGRMYMCVASVSSLSGMHGDTAAGGWQDISKYTGEYAKNIFNGEVGNFYGVRFVEETGYFSNTIGSGSTHGQAVFFGSDAVYEMVAIPEEMRTKTSTDYGRDMGLAWYFLGGWKTVWSYTGTPAEQHIVYLTSA
jgi:N4-gp56 family major capsid protein